MFNPPILVVPMPPHTMRWWLNRIDQIDFSPGYQREGNLWSPSDKAYLIDSILNGFDIPKIYLADFTQGSPELNRKLLPYAVIDGKQRLEAIADFASGRVALNANFTYLAEPSLPLGGLYYAELASRFPRVADRFDEFELPIMSVITSQQGLVDELFVRLNRSKPLTGAELRNAANAPVAVMIRKLSEHEFFASYVRFPRSRGQDKNLAAKLLFFEYLGKPSSTKKKDLDSFAHALEINHERVRIALASATRNLDKLTEIFLPNDPLLNSAGTLPVYYWLVRETAASSHVFVRQFLALFEEQRRLNRELAQQHPGSERIDRELADYDFHNRNTNDVRSYEQRFDILRRRFPRFTEEAAVGRRTSKVNPASSAVRDIYLFAQSKLNMMLLACHTDEQRSEIRLQLMKARHNWQAVENQVFQKDDAALVDLINKAVDVAGELRTIEQRLGNISEVIAILTQGATYGAQIVGKTLAL